MLMAMFGRDQEHKREQAEDFWQIHLEIVIHEVRIFRHERYRIYAC